MTPNPSSNHSAAAAPRGFWRRARTWERAGALLLGVGLVMLMQPWSLRMFSYSFTVLLTGVVIFSVAVKLPQD
jgi:hypothetical protein